ncbi:TRIM3 [Branchiostoma lanceolatum]|uniref:TRIM3 protein n=1 Tax=Branchiostoma lanceolatum TaxID=7740 RepID=A0A8S4MNV3_BRALA|nr:TRIM3 [Branchiostoma lanceolatum]
MPILQPATSRAGRRTTGSAAHAWPDVLMKTDEVTPADVIKVSPVHGHGPSHGITAEIEAAGPTPINMPVSTMTDIKALLQVYNIEGVYLCQFLTGTSGLGYPSKTPHDVSIDRDGHLWVLMSGQLASPISVVQVSRNGHLKVNFDLPDTVPRGVIRGMAVDLRNNHFFVTWSGRYCGGVQAFDPKGKLLWDVGPPQRMMRPMHVAVKGKGNIFMSDVRSYFVYQYDETGQYVSKFGGPGLKDGHLSRPRGICLDTFGHILVVDSLNQRVVLFTDQGAYVRSITVHAEYPSGVAVGPWG